MTEERGWALVTGASSGIGAVFARSLAARGYRVALVARRADRLERLADELGRERALPLAQDLSRPGACEWVRGELLRREIVPDLLVNNAGLGHTGAYVHEPIDKTRGILAVNVVALAELTRLILPAMVERGRGAIINVCSMSAFQPVPFLATYAASKAFVLSFTESLAEELAGTGVRVQALCPGLVPTEFQENAGTDKVRFNDSPPQTPELVVEASLRALEAGDLIVIPGISDRLGVQLQRLLPRTLVRRIAAALFRPKR